MQHISHLGKQSYTSSLLFLKKNQITWFSSPCLGPEIWLEYAQYSIGGIGQEGGIERVRSIFERALTAVGLHVTKGTALWEAYREFENAILETAQVSPFPFAPIPKKAVVQLLESPGAVSSLSRSGCFFPAVKTSPVLQENHSVDLADKIKDLCFS